MSQQPLLIVLNGASSSGKTSTARAIQQLLGSGCVITGLDDILERTQPFGPESHNALDAIARSARILWFQATDGRLKLFKQLHHEVIALAQTGHDVVVEIAYMDRRALLDAAVQFAPLDGLLVGMKPPLEISEAWETARTDRPRGQARKHYDLVHAHNNYDLLIDSSKMSPQECASAIIEYLQQSKPHSFRQLLEQ